MYNLKIHFVYPWLMLLLIPAAGLMLFHYFRLSKKYRRTRNRIISLVLHMLVMTLCISVLSGIGFSYNVDNSTNEIILLIDGSYSTSDKTKSTDNYLKDVVNMGSTDAFRIGVVTFGYDQVYAVPLTDDYDSIYSKYKDAESPDMSASDIASALLYARDRFGKGKKSKIVLLTDGLETDSSALSAVRELTGDGITVDVVRCDAIEVKSDIQMMSVDLPDYNIAIGEKFDISVSFTGKLDSSVSDLPEAVITMYDNDNEVGTVKTEMRNGSQTVTFSGCSFDTGGLHTLKFVASGSADALSENSTVYSFINLNTYNDVLIIEKFKDSSNAILDLLTGYNVTVTRPNDPQMPETLSELRRYDEVIFNNIANADLPDGFDEILYKYVYELGGGLFTVGGGEENDPETAHAFNRTDMASSLYYRQLIPVEAINYTPPLGLMLVIDISGTMQSSSDIGTKVEAAKNAAINIVNDPSCLSERDYCGIMTLSDSFSQEIRLLPMTRQNDIRNAILNISGTGGTVFSPSVDRAGKDLRALYETGAIQKMHVIIITDGLAADYKDYIELIEYYHARGVTYSFVAIDAGVDTLEKLNVAAEKGGGNAMIAKASNLTALLKDDIRIPEIKETELGSFIPKIDKDSFYSTVVEQENMPALNGFYGTRPKSGAEVILTGDFNVPVFAQWRCGAGNVGSFMCDLNNVWSADFLSDVNGRLLVLSMISKLMPTRDVKNTDITVAVRPVNYSLDLSIYTASALRSDERIEVSATYFDKSDAAITVEQPTKADGYSRATVKTYEPGMYWITVNRVNDANELVSSYVFHYGFSYSDEYDIISEKPDLAEFSEQIALLSGGSYSEIANAEASKVFEGFVTKYKKTYDPRVLFIAIALGLFLLDIAVRKFKFKWIHELVRDKRERKKSAGPGKDKL